MYVFCSGLLTSNYEPLPWQVYLLSVTMILLNDKIGIFMCLCLPCWQFYDNHESGYLRNVIESYITSVDSARAQVQKLQNSTVKLLSNLKAK